MRKVLSIFFMLSMMALPLKAQTMAEDAKSWAEGWKYALSREGRIIYAQTGEKVHQHYRLSPWCRFLGDRIRLSSSFPDNRTVLSFRHLPLCLALEHTLPFWWSRCSCLHKSTRRHQCSCGRLPDTLCQFLPPFSGTSYRGCPLPHSSHTRSDNSC